MKNTTINQARQILDTHTSGELAAKLGIKSTNFSGLKSGKRPLTEKMAARIVQAYEGMTPTAKTLARKSLAEEEAGQKKPAAKKTAAKPEKPEEKEGTWVNAAEFIFEHEAKELEPKMEKMAREIMERVMKGEAFPAIVKRVVEIVHEELEKVAGAKVKEPEARSLRTPPERLEKMPDLIASVTVLNEEAKKVRRFWRRSK